MTDTGQVPGEGQPENAGTVEQQGAPAPGAYTYLSEHSPEEDLLLPGAQGAWGNEVAPPAPEPVVETVHQPGPHETAGRDSGSVDLGGFRLPDPVQRATPAHGTPHEQGTPAAPRRPLHLGPPIPSASASPVRSLADRGPADVPARQAGPPTMGPEYLDVPRTPEAAPQGAVPWGERAAVPLGATPAGTAYPEAGPSAADAPAAAAAAGEAWQRDPQPDAVPAAASGAPAATAVPDAQGVPAPVPQEAVTVPEAAAEPGTAVGGTDGAVAPEAPDVATPPTAEAPEPVGAPASDAAPAGHPVEVPTGAVPGDGTGGEPAAPEAAAPEAAGPEPVAPQAADAEGAVPGPAVGEPVAETPGAPEPAVADAPVPEAVVADVAAPEAVVAEQAEPVVTEPAEIAEPAEPAEPAPAEQAGPVVAEQAEPAAPEAVAPVAGPDTPVAAEPVAAAPETVPQHAPAPVEQHDAMFGPAAVDVPADPGAPAPEAPLAQDGTPQAAPAEGHEPVAPPAPAGGAAAPVPEVSHPGPAAAPQQHPEQAPGTPEAPEPTDAVAAAQDAHAPGAVPEAPVSDVPLPTQEGLPAAAEADARALQDPQQTPPVPLAAAEAHPALPEPADPDRPAAGDQDSAAPEQPVGEFVPVEGSVPTTPHLAPTPPHPLHLTEEQPVAAVPAPRAPQGAAAGGEAGLLQQADDMDTQGAEAEVPPARDGDPADTPTASDAAADPDPDAAADPDPDAAPPPAGPAAPGYDDAEREAVLKVMRERRDIRNGFRSDPIPHEVLLRVLEAAHTAPSVGHSQPWDFVVIRSADTRRSMHELAMRQRDAYAKSLPKGRAKQFKELKIEAILDTPVNIVVTADPTRGGRHTLGRHTQPQMAPYSSALAVENLWLAARAEGLGVGWVSFFDEREMVRALGLPEHLEVVAYLCVGYVDEFPDEPELMQAGWSKRRPLSWVVHEETYGRRALPGEDPHDLLAETVAQIRPLDAKALGEAWERQKRMTKPAGALGMLEIISAQLSGLSRQCPPPIPEPAAVAVFAGDHGVHAQGVTPWPQEVTAQMVANFLGGGAVCNAFAAQVGAEVCVIDVGVASDLPATPGLLPRKIRAGTSDMTTGPAMTREEAKQAIEVGIETARDLVAAGNKALLTGEMGIANTTASAALISVFTGADPAEVTGRGTGINDETLVRKTDVVRRALEHHRPDPADPLGVLAAVGGFEHAAMVGLLLGGASLRTPVILDGVSAGAAALVARAIAPEVLAACIAGHRSAEPGHVAALNKLGLRPLVDLDLRLGEGTGALLALPLVQSTARAMHEVATFDSAGVTEK
ncbi:nicotinate-nucleotide--dimethylbenzimidazole phosphoribosyltransferase [Streptomyces sp. NPDC101219]|uniref:nicotinate-nucleotide--dimethylbenzimidazole phosphoribosyltransferase n=1 Tax=Streptomyces sp. NPDC101219 TaxID=3366131 RepID=UPI00382F4BFF